MSSSPHEQPLRVVLASGMDGEAVMQLLHEARQWHMQNGLDVWQAFEPVLITADIAAGRIFVARVGDTVCGAVTLTEDDLGVWGTDQQSALYVHRLVSSRKVMGRGIGAAMLDWAQDVARQRGRRACAWKPGIRTIHSAPTTKSRVFSIYGTSFSPTTARCRWTIVGPAKACTNLPCGKQATALDVCFITP